MNNVSIMSMIMYVALSVCGLSVGSPRVSASVAAAMRNIRDMVERLRFHVDRMNIPIVAKKKSNVRVSIIS